MLGLNAIAAYMFSELLWGSLNMFTFPFSGRHWSALAWVWVNIFGQIPDPGWACFAYSFCYMAVCFIPIWILYRKRIFLKV